MKWSNVEDKNYELLLRIIRARRSVRNFKPDVPERDLILKVIDAARYAPSATNFQPWMFFIITNSEVMEMMASAVIEKLNRLNKTKMNREVITAENIKEFGEEYFLFFRKAPVIIATFLKPYPDIAELGYEINTEEKEKKLLLSVESTSAAVQNLLLATCSLGLGACWLDGPLIARREIESILGVKAPWSLMCLIALGYPKKTLSPPRRKKLEHITRFIN